MDMYELLDAIEIAESESNIVKAFKLSCEGIDSVREQIKELVELERMLVSKKNSLESLDYEAIESFVNSFN